MSEIKIYTQHEVAKQLDGLYVTLADHEAAIKQETEVLRQHRDDLKAEVERLKNWIKANAEHTDRCVAVSGDCGGDCICYIRDLLKGGGSG